ncbi:MAG: septal ring lytic transglycosylase RlpA family protein [Rubrobacteraceae bacterium]|jgi:rare lipoprotein A|nr:septal ring lytic transglycosylase RlpA family protein [Rubrobacter sp.]
MKFVFAALIALMIAAFAASEAKADTTLASWYGPGFAGNPTASGETYDPSGFTAAHKTLPLGTPITVSYGGSSVDLIVNDRGPYVGDRELDLSQAAAETLGLDAAGVDYVDYSVGGGAAAPTTSAAPTPAPAPVAPATTGFEDTMSGSPQTFTEGQSASGGFAESSVEMSGSGGQGGSYTVQSGDTLDEISGQLGVSMHDLASANGLDNPDVLSVGQTLHY